jgi:hypothetical protein
VLVAPTVVGIDGGFVTSRPGPSCSRGRTPVRHVRAQPSWLLLVIIAHLVG